MGYFDIIWRQRHPSERADYDTWSKQQAWTVDEAVALSMGDNPNWDWNAKPAVGVEIYHGVMRLRRIVDLTNAVERGELPATQENGVCKVRPHDFCTWLKRQGGRDPWHLLPDLFQFTMYGYIPAKVDNFFHTEKKTLSRVANVAVDNRSGEPGVSVSNAEVRCRDYLIAEMKKSPNEPPKTKDQYRKECKEEKFPGLGSRPFNRAWDDAIEATKSSWAKPGRRRKSIC